MPFIPNDSSLEPTLNQNPSENDFTWGIVSVKILIPLGRIVFLYWFKFIKIIVFLVQKIAFKYREMVSGSQGNYKSYQSDNYK
jgi:hypothetical protein